jgi:hypothetical protein
MTYNQSIPNNNYTISIAPKPPSGAPAYIVLPKPIAVTQFPTKTKSLVKLLHGDSTNRTDENHFSHYELTGELVVQHKFSDGAYNTVKDLLEQDGTTARPKLAVVKITSDKIDTAGSDIDMVMEGHITRCQRMPFGQNTGIQMFEWALSLHIDTTWANLPASLT